MNIAQTSLLPLVVDNGDGTCTPVVATADTVTVTATQDYDINCFVAGKPANAALVLRYVVVRAFSLPASLTGSRSSAVTASTGTKAFSLKNNGVEFGTVTFTASATGVLAAAAETDFSVGDVLSIVAPATQDATLADISINLKGTLT